ncbi:MAG: UvrD-helicase domain-containing protein [Patescibacteria group bacterium]|nr:UvrD-helicase domain-containing protein [Patescibacteria group bacterium]
MSKILDYLNKKQKEAVVQTDGSVLILAGAGSGKTRALTYRVAYLIKEKKVLPRHILAMTFTNKAAGEMLERVKHLLGLPSAVSRYSPNLPHIGTFHSICARILRKEIEKMGYERNFAIYDSSDQLAVMKRVIKKLEISQEQFKPQIILGAISNAKNKLVGSRKFKQQVGSFFEEQVSKCYTKYQKELREASALDFDDILMLIVELFQKHPDILENYQNLFKYIMVDEYQDTNHAQYVFLKMLAEKSRNICVVGDDWQSIYGWRGADVQNILNFEKDYPEAKVILLEQNYRSTQNVLDAAHCVISKNTNRKDKKLWTKNDSGSPITLFEARDEKDESDFVVNEINLLRKEMKLKLDDFAVLYRTNAQSRALEEAFMKVGIPYKIIGGFKFYERKEVKDILAYLLFARNPNDKVSFERVVNIPARGIGRKTIDKIMGVCEQNKIDILEAIKSIVSVPAEDPKERVIVLSKIKTLEKFHVMLRNFRQTLKNMPVSKLITKIYKESGYEQMLSKNGEEGAVRQENIQELLTVAQDYDGQENGADLFLEEVALVSQTDNDLDAQNLVPLMTLHSAKGLEYETVFIVGMEEGLLPHSRAILNEKEMEEERRLCYVGITRAKQKAHLIYTATRTIYGSTQISIRSRFVDEIDNHLFEQRYSQNESDEFFTDSFSNDGNKRKSERQGFIKRTEDVERIIDLGKKGERKQRDAKFKDGDRVKHKVFGEGIVVSQDAKAINVVFPIIGLKKFAKGVAPLEKAQ